MDKLKYIRVQEEGGTYSSDIPLAVDAENVTMLNGHDLQETLGDLNVTSADDVTTQLSSLHSSVNSLNQQKVNHSDLTTYIDTTLATDVTNWLDTNVTPTGSATSIDKSLTIENSAADAKIVGLQINNLDEKLNNIPATAIYTERVTLNGTLTNSYAWDITGNPVPGNQYNYTTYDITNEKGQILITGASWGSSYPLASFYDSNNTLISTIGTTGDTRYTQKRIFIPPKATKLIVNGYLSPYISSVLKYKGMNQVQKNRSFIQPYGIDINSSYITNHPNFANLRNWPGNRIYNLGTSAYQAIDNIPSELQSYASLIKYIGYVNPEADHMGYSGYILMSPTNAWYGFDTGTQIVWNAASGNKTDKTILFIGDSYAQGYSHDGNNSGWCNYMVEYMNINASKYTISANGGASFSNSSNSFLSLLNSATTKNYTDIIVCGGFNDYLYTSEQIINNIISFINRAKTLYPNATIHIGCIGWIKQGTGSSSMTNWEEIRNIIKNTVIPAYQNGSIRHGAQYLNNVEFILNDSHLTDSDGYHPSELGNRQLAEGITNALLTGTAPLNTLRL